MSRARALGLITVLVVSAVVGTALAVARSDRGGRQARTPSSTGTSTPQPNTPAPDVRWVELAGVALPVSATDGPRQLSNGLARGFSDTADGAALAAVNLVVRTSPSLAPAITTMTIQQQVVGPNQPALLRSVAEARSTQPPPATATIAGFVPVYYNARQSASVDLVIGSPELALRRQYVSVRVALQWSDDDWRLVAPPQGDWGTVTSAIDALPVGMRRYGA